MMVIKVTITMLIVIIPMITVKIFKRIGMTMTIITIMIKKL